MILCLSGSNHYALRRALDERLGRLGPAVEITRLSGEQVAPHDLPQLLGGASLFASERAVVLREASANKPVWERLGELLSTIDDSMTLILVEPSPDKRTKTYKQLQKLGEVKQFDEPNERELVNWLQREAQARGANLEPEAARFLLHYVGNEQGLLASELDKLALADNSIDRATIERHSEPTPQASAFEVVDAVMAARRDQLHEQLAALKATEDPYRFFGLLSSQVSALIACAAGGQRSSQQIAKDFGIHPFVAQKSQPLARRLGISRLRTMNRLLAECDLQIKTSKGEPWQLIELTIMKMTAP